MYISSVLLAALVSAHVNAIPLNINLGAYSPALVVGDGEISFKGKEEVSQLMDALEGAAVSGAAKNGGGDANVAAAAEAPGFDGAAGVAQAQTEPPSNAPVQSTPIQGMGKHIAPRYVNLVKRDSTDKRDITGFNAALSYASDALTKGPTVELATGSAGSGVGVKVSPKGAGRPSAQIVGAAPPPPPANDAKPAPPKGGGNGLGRRDEVSNTKTQTTVTKMIVRGGLSSESEDRETGYVEKRTSPNSSSIDDLNLNVPDGGLAELTFVETRSIDDVINE